MNLYNNKLNAQYNHETVKNLFLKKNIKNNLLIINCPFRVLFMNYALSACLSEL